MAGLRSNVAWLGAAKQTAKGTAAATPLYKNPFSGGNVAPVRDTDRLEETDASRDRGTAYVTTSGVEGDPEIYARAPSLGFYLVSAFGTVVTTGAAAPYTHTITPGNALPYVTLWRMIGDTLYERFEDCMVSEITVSADAGSPLTCGIGVQGRRAVRLTADPAGTPVTTAPVFNFNEAAVELGGGATSLIGSFEMTVSNNVTRQQTDDVVPYDVVAGRREVSIGFNLIFENLDEYNKFHYGGSAGTAISSNIFTTSAKFTFTKDVNTEVVFNFPSLAYEEFPVDPDPGGDPIVVPVRAGGERGTEPIVTVTLKNAVASY